MDETLLAEARQAQERLIDAERDADVARAEFHRAVRRLHLHGASLRELASGLGLSHQRVHQIAGPSVYICDGCIDLAKVVLSDGLPVTTEIAELIAGPADEPRIQCSFC